MNSKDIEKIKRILDDMQQATKEVRELIIEKDNMIIELTNTIEELENELNAYKNNKSEEECTLGYIPDDRDTYGDITD